MNATPMPGKSPAIKVTKITGTCIIVNEITGLTVIKPKRVIPKITTKAPKAPVMASLKANPCFEFSIIIKPLKKN